MPQCCVCSNQGRCQNCSCVKGGRSCSNCHPSKHGKCSNLNKNPVREQSIQVYVHENVQQNSEARFHNEESQHNSQVQRELPTFTPLSEPNFQWSETVNGPTCKEYVNVSYQKSYTREEISSQYHPGKWVKPSLRNCLASSVPTENQTH